MKEEGFLSAGAKNWVSVHRKRNAEWFAFAENLNRLAHKLHDAVMELKDESNELFTSRLLFLRCHTSFQAGIILAERGLTADAQGTIRSAFEALICLAGCVEGSNVVEQLTAADTHHKKKLGKALVNMPADLMGATQLEPIQAFLDANPDKFKDMNIREIAIGAGLGEVYDVYFRSLSNDGAHISISSLNRHANAVGNVVSGFRYGADMPDVTKTITYGCVVGIYLVKVGSERFKVPAVDQEMAEIWPIYTDLIARTPLDQLGEDGSAT